MTLSAFDLGSWQAQPHGKEWATCVSCSQLKIIIWLGMCGCCAKEHKRRTIEAREQWKKELDEMKAEHPWAA